MKCSHAQKLISKLADGATPGDALTAHLTGCPSCRRFAAFCDALPASLAVVSAPAAASSDFVAGVMDRIEPAHRPLIVPWRWSDFLRPVPISVAAAAFALGVFVTSVSQSVANGTDTGTGNETAEAGVYDAGFGIDTVDDAVFALFDDQEN